MTEDFNKSLKKEYHKDLVGIILFPTLITLISIFAFILFLIPTIRVCKDGGNIVYSDSAAVSYRDAEYNKYFDEENEKNSIIVVFLVEDMDEKYDQFFCISKVGDNVADKIKNEFGNNQSSFGKAVLKEVDDKYEDSFSDDISAIMTAMIDEIKAHELESSFKDDSVAATADTSVSRVINYTPLTISKETVNKALKSFSLETDIPVIVVIGSIDNVFERQLPFKDFLIMALLLGVIGFCIYNTTRKVILRVRYEYHPELFVQKSIYDKDEDDDYDAQPKTIDAEYFDKTDGE